MDSEAIKEVLIHVSNLVATGDKTFRTERGRHMASVLFKEATNRFYRSPMMAAAVVQHLMDAGFDLNQLKSTAYTDFLKQFGPKLSRIDDTQRQHIRTISRNLFQQLEKKPVDSVFARSESAA